MAVDLGTDVAVFASSTGYTDPLFALVSGARAIADSVMRLWHDDVDGLDLSELLSSPIAEARLWSLEGALRDAALVDERVGSISVRLTRPSSETLRIAGNIIPADGSKPFAYVFEASPEAIKVLSP